MEERQQYRLSSIVRVRASRPRHAQMLGSVAVYLPSTTFRYPVANTSATSTISSTP
jgi:hypothetical protein